MAELADELGPLLEATQYALVGHSMGAILAFELSRVIQSLALPAPASLFVAACPPPDSPKEGSSLSALDDGTLWGQLGEMGGISTEILSNEEWMSLLLPIVRADLEMLDYYQYQPGAILTHPIVALAGRDDPATDLVALRRWSAQTSGTFSQEVFEGGHFFVFDEPDAVCSAIARTLAMLHE